MNRLKELRKSKGATLEKVANLLNIGTNTLSQYENGKREANHDMLLKLADYYNVSVDYLMGREQKSENNISSTNLGSSHTRIPVYGTIPAGIPIEMIDQSFIEDYEDIDSELLKNGQKYFCLKVTGESMYPKFEDGDVLVLKQQPDCENGDYCAVSINHTECTFKKVIKHEQGITLQPLNPAFTPLFFSKKDIEELPITILGVVKEVRRSL